MRFLKSFIFCVALISFQAHSQETNTIKEINQDVWVPFTSAFETLDVDLFKSIHSANLIRVAANAKQIKNFETYTNDYRRNWETINRKQTISFRFIERLSNDTTASERGIYKFTINPNTEEEQSYYGKFHVFLTKENEVWKILIDYDSNENNSINENAYQKAFAIDDYDK